MPASKERLKKVFHVLFRRRPSKLAEKRLSNEADNENQALNLRWFRVSSAALDGSNRRAKLRRTGRGGLKE